MANAFCALAFSLASAASGQAAQTAQNISQPAQLRLLSAGRDADTGKYRAVVEIALAPGYKTYWRDPGDSGVPTEFMWEKSEHIANVQARFPVPTRFFDGSGHAIGYLQTVRFPVEVSVASNGKNPLLRLTASFGVCREICIPEQAEAEVVLSDVESIAGLWYEAIARLPLQAKPGESVGDLELQQSRLTASELRLVVAGAVGEQTDVFVEAPDGWQFGQPKRLVQEGGLHFMLPVLASRTNAESVALKVTVKGEASAIEVPLSVPFEQ